MGFMKVLDKLMSPFLKIIMKNRWGYTESEYQKALELGLFDVLGMEAMSYWLVVEPFKSLFRLPQRGATFLFQSHGYARKA
jgi:hypothetical protein